MTDTASKPASDAPPPYAVAARALLRDSLLDAAGTLLRDRSWGEVTMAEVARAAGVSRQTLYNEFGSRPEFAQAYVLREADRFIAAVELDDQRERPRRRGGARRGLRPLHRGGGREPARARGADARRRERAAAARDDTRRVARSNARRRGWRS